MDKSYTISVLMTKHRGALSRAIYLFTGLGYTHASVSLDEEDVYYSFNKKGFRKERPKLYKESITKSICYKISVSKHEYEKMMETINDFQSKRPDLKYSKLGVVLCCMGISHKFKGQYFCSQFVAELLENADVITLKRSPSVYSPKKLNALIRGHINLLEVVSNPI